MTNTADTTQDVHVTSPDSTSVPVPAKAEAPKKIVLLLEFLSTQVPPKLRIATYNTIVSAVKDGVMTGLIHPSEKGRMTVVNRDNEEKERLFRHVLLKNSENLTEQLDQQCLIAMNAELVRSRGQNMTVEEMMDMEEDLDFDAIAAAAQVKPKPAVNTKPKPAPTNSRKVKPKASS